MRINQVVDNQYHTLLDDKAFIKQFSMLLALIVAISLFLIYYSVKRVDHVQLPSLGKDAHKAMSLGEVEREINDNVIGLEVLEDNFSDLAEMELQQLEKSRYNSADRAAKRPVAVSTHTAPAKRAHVIEITSVPLRHSKSRPTSLQRLKKRFYKTHEIKYALEIAERLMRAKNYKEALKWSLIANEIAPDSAKSWMMFANIKLKMGKKQDAVNVLQAYLKTYDSTKISRMLKKIERS